MSPTVLSKINAYSFTITIEEFLLLIKKVETFLLKLLDR